VAAPLSRPATTPSVPTPEPGAFSLGKCGNCGAELTGPFCSQCGEKRLTPKDYSLGHFIEEAIDSVTHLDSRFLRTFKLLFRKPGELSNAFFHGGRSRYTKPLSLFIIINIVFFFVQPHTGLFGYKYSQYMKDQSHRAAVQEHLRETRESEQNYAARFNANLQNQKKSVLIFAVPVLALLMTVLFAGSGRTYAEHLVFSVQVYAFLLVYLAAVVFLVLYPLIAGTPSLWPGAKPFIWSLQTETGIDVILFLGLSVYMYLGFRRAYHSSRIRSGINAVVLAGATGATIAAYHSLLFYLSFWTT
jgi:hypothetical protein